MTGRRLWKSGQAAVAVVCLAAVAAPHAARAEAPADEGTVIVAVGGYWRQHVTVMPPLVSADSARAAGMEESARRLKRRTGRSKIISLPATPPPAGWAGADFDDRRWDRVMGVFSTGHQEVGQVCRRSKFVVSEPAGVRRLTLEIGYVGGAVAWLNGREVLRTSMPDGPITHRTPAADYPHEAFFVASGPRKGKLLHSYYDRKLPEQFALRARKAGPVELPVKLLRKGVNVLALELHSANYPARCAKTGVGHFAAIGLDRLFLRARAAPGAVTPAVSRPRGFQVFNAEVTEEVTELDYGQPAEGLGPVRIAGLGNGTWSGQVVVASTEAIEGLSARIGPLRRVDGGAAIPASSVRVRYGRLGRVMRYRGGSVYGGPTGTSLGVYFRRFDGLLDRPPASIPPTSPAEKLRVDRRQGWGLPGAPVAAAMAPVWVSVAIPAGTAAGLYRAALTIRAQGKAPVHVPVELEVFGWSLPPAGQYVSELSVYQSPDTLAARYKVPLWSDRHWELVERSVRLIGAASNHTIIIPLLSKEQVGNEQSYVRWVRGPGGSFEYDTSVMDRYVDLYLRHHDRRRIKAVCLVVWGNAGVAKGNPYQKHKYDARGVPLQTRGTFTVTVLDPQTGAADMPLPALGTDAYEAFWRPVLGKVRQRLAARGLADRIMLGMPADPSPSPAAVAAFRNILPEAGWFVGNHPGRRHLGYDPKDRKKIVPVVHVERVYTSLLPDPASKRLFGWQRKQMALAFNRYGFGPLCLYPSPSVWAFRMLMEADLASGHRGAGRIGADYWPMPGGNRRSGSGGTFYSRYPHSATGQTGLGANCRALLAAGPDGPVTSARFENVREGIQNAEAVIFVQKALLGGQVPGPLAKRAWAVLDERTGA
ncbi:MAG: glycoside hydrolase domain-containing protein, partial [Planctomycetota bacterium]